MPIFECDNCHCLENTALGNYWTRSLDIWPAEYRGKKLCSECGPPFYSDGKKSGFGKWHGRFKKESAAGLPLNEYGFLG
jgi:hypothetical protein